MVETYIGTGHSQKHDTAELERYQQQNDPNTCLKCWKICKSMSVHQNKCLNTDKGASFCRNEKIDFTLCPSVFAGDGKNRFMGEKVKKGKEYDTTNKVLPLSQPLASLWKDERSSEYEIATCTVQSPTNVIDDQLPDSSILAPITTFQSNTIKKSMDHQPKEQLM